MTADLGSSLRQLAAIEAILRARGVELPKTATPRRRRSVDPADRDLNPLQWAVKYRRIDGKPFSLARHKPLEAIYEDDHPHIVIMKCAQVGASEMAVTRTLHALDVGAYYWKTGKEGLNVAYLFPTGKALGDFSKERLGSTLEEHPHIADMFRGGFNDITFKQAGASYLYLRSAFIPAGGKKNTAAEQLLSFPADLLLLDEYDRMSPAAVTMIEKRIRASIVGRQYNISTPTLPGRGVHGIFLLSDQRVWEVPCPSCGLWIEMNFFRDVYGKRADETSWEPYAVWSTWSRETIERAFWSVRCLSCQEELDRFAPGRWTAQAPEVRSIRGYHLPALAFPTVQLRTLAKNATSTDPTHIEEFFRSDLGLPYEAEGSKITQAMLDALPSPSSDPPRTGYILGVDVGARFHYRLSAGMTGPKAERTIVAMGSVRGWDELARLFERYPITRCIIDAQPELNATKDFAEKYTGKVWRAYYTSDRTQKGELFRTDEDKGVIYINRTMAMDMLYARIADGVDLWPRSIIRDDEVRQHLTAPSRTNVVNPQTGDVTPMWVHTAPDHLFHASLYDTVAALARSTARASAFVQGKTRGWSPQR